MRIDKAVYDYILNNVPMFPPEMGGILGIRSNVIREVEFDKGLDTGLICTYAPNVDYLNDVIEKWSEENIEFCGIFHTHFYGVRTLSDGDREYINSILLAMPENMDRLYFPIVLPEEKKLVSYLATRNGKEIQIVEEAVEVL